MIPQTSDQWLPARVGRLTASDMWLVVDRQEMRLKKDGTPYKGAGEHKAGRAKLRDRLATERYFGYAKDNFVSSAMRDGLEREPTNKLKFQVETGLVIRPGGLIYHPRIEHFAATPDGFIGNDACFEAKCPTFETFAGWLREDIVPPEHEAQMLAQLACSTKSKTYFSAYFPAEAVPAFHPEIKRRELFWKLFEPPIERIRWIEEEAITFLKEVEEVFWWLVEHYKEQ